MHKNLYTIILLGCLLNSCSFPTTKEAGIKYSTRPAFQVPKNIEWKEVGLAKELINIKEKIVIISGGSNPLPLHEWEELKVRFPWQKNIDRHILINKTALVRSPNAHSNCNRIDCLIERKYRGYSWIELAQPLAVDFIPSKTDKDPLVILPFGKGEECYFNIVGDHLGQGYHQYKYANEYYPQ